MNLSEWNQLPRDQAAKILVDACAAGNWAEGLAARGPFEDLAAMKTASDEVWLQMGRDDFLEAFQGHPQIGNVDTLRAKFAHTKAVAAGEQSGVDAASEETLTRLAALNAQYLKRFGYIFIVFATGKSAAEMLAILEERIENDPQTELAIAAAEQHKITGLRLEKMF